ncbi:DUF397 domain-containing protein [Streptomyces graminilatus]|uniref:DUF397 domain-containing protein n=1 Tax=Streptomyces graminilatus TaxID=1464070 RepID=UPI0006E215C8|nr:DUF397 domain-containing protein [Streptomyces graminilatus]
MDTPTNWRKSSFSGSTNECVEIADLPGRGRAVRDSKNPGGGFVSFTASEWRAFISRVKGSDFHQ